MIDAMPSAPALPLATSSAPRTPGSDRDCRRTSTYVRPLIVPWCASRSTACRADDAVTSAEVQQEVELGVVGLGVGDDVWNLGVG